MQPDQFGPDKHDVPISTSGTPVIARPAASLLVMRGRGPTLEILMARRGAGHKFMPNVLVFPGGAVDPADYTIAPASPLRPHVRARLERAAPPDLAHALAAAAARELTEEVGCTLGDPPHLAPLDYFCRAITPPDRTMRFDARFFMVDAEHVAGDPCASDELLEPGWYSLDAALAGELALATKAILWKLREWLENPVHGETVPTLRDRAWHHE